MRSLAKRSMPSSNRQLQHPCAAIKPASKLQLLWQYLVHEPQLTLCAFLATELETHLNVADKTLAEFIVEIAKDVPTVDAFKKVSQPQRAQKHRVSNRGSLK